MCAILGISFLNGHKITSFEPILKLLEHLFIRCQNRGTDAAGLAVVNMDNITVVKNTGPAVHLIQSREYQETLIQNLNIKTIYQAGDLLNMTYSLIGHCRCRTKGSEYDNINNHPIVARTIVGVHNGMISNDEELFTEHKRKFYNFLRDGVVDSEIIFRLIDHDYTLNKISVIDAIKNASKLLEGSFSCAIACSKKPNLLWLFSNTGAIDGNYYPESGIFVFASTRTHIDDAVHDSKQDFGRSVSINISQNTGLALNLDHNRSVSFDIK